MADGAVVNVKCLAEAGLGSSDGMAVAGGGEGSDGLLDTSALAADMAAAAAGADAELGHAAASGNGVEPLPAQHDAVTHTDQKPDHDEDLPAAEDADDEFDRTLVKAEFTEGEIDMGVKEDHTVIAATPDGDIGGAGDGGDSASAGSPNDTAAATAGSGVKREAAADDNGDAKRVRTE